ncbi:serine/threonine protein kinase [Pleurocapsa sp. FMAR1]|uniref:serine/threonine protein kinase n=1 Tax=Pleurocapsa sp. FMAR1 TaxID=3040204 RepID=UPI0029C657F3|nr:serine/threonine-protein kinase [Pleurocapsa sp. FMAR1]
MTSLSLDSRKKLLNRRYYLHELIAQSSNSRVFLASDLVLRHQKCVIKQLCLNFSSAQEKQTRELIFQEEAQILKKLAGKHSQICQFYDYFSDSHGLYLVQEWIQGVTLEQKLSSQQKLSESETRDILLNLLPVLECIHSLGIVHRDIKPSNIILRAKDNLPVLIDFGVAHRVSTRRQKLIVGTPGYMSLEQAMGHTTYNNDLYSLGLTAIHLLTGKSPLTFDFEINQSNFEQQKRTASNQNLMVVIERAIAPNYSQRFASAKEMLSALQFPKATSSLTPTNTHKFRLKSWAIYFMIGIQLTWVCLGLNYLTSELDERPPINLLDSQAKLLLPTDDDIEPIDKKTKNLPTKNNALQAVIFIPGTSESKILQALGEPVWRQPGFWANSIAWSYENVVSKGIDLGYVFDTQTNKLRQAEIAVPPATNFNTVYSALDSLLAVEPTPDLKQGLQAVYRRQKTTYDFSVNGLKGIIQRNQKDRIYIAVWEADFH